MTKEEVISGLRAAGLFHRYDKSAHWWKKAFEVYNSQHGTKLDMGCTTCIRTVKEWLDK